MSIYIAWDNLYCMGYSITRNVRSTCRRVSTGGRVCDPVYVSTPCRLQLFRLKGTRVTCV